MWPVTVPHLGQKHQLICPTSYIYCRECLPSLKSQPVLILSLQTRKWQLHSYSWNPPTQHSIRKQLVLTEMSHINHEDIWLVLSMTTGHLSKAVKLPAPHPAMLTGQTPDLWEDAPSSCTCSKDCTLQESACPIVFCLFVLKTISVSCIRRGLPKPRVCHYWFLAYTKDLAYKLYAYKLTSISQATSPWNGLPGPTGTSLPSFPYPRKQV